MNHETETIYIQLEGRISRRKVTVQQVRNLNDRFIG
jgi:hypothetical protein